MREFMKPQIKIICFTTDIVCTSGGNTFPENAIEGTDNGWGE